MITDWRKFTTNWNLEHSE